MTSVVSLRAVETWRASSHTSIISQQCESTIRTEFDTLSVDSLRSRHVRILINRRGAFSHTSLRSLISVRKASPVALHQTFISSIISDIRVGTCVQALSDRIC